MFPAGAPRVSTRQALGRGVGVMRRMAWRSFLVAFAGVGGFFLLLAALGAIYDYDAFGPTAPGGRAADVEGFAILGYFAVALYMVTLWFGVAAVTARDDGSGRPAWRIAARHLWRDVWWAMPAMGACIFLSAVVVPAPFLVAPLALIGAARANRVEMRDGAVPAAFWRMLVVALVPTALAAVVQLTAGLAGDTASPPIWLQLVISTVAAALALSAIACTAGAAVAMLDEFEERPISWSPPSPTPVPSPTPLVAPPYMFAPVPTAPVRRGMPTVRIIWIIVLGAMVAVLAVGGLAQMGDPYPLSRTAVLLDEQGLQVVNAACPGDRLLYAEMSEPGNQVVAPTLRWSVRGDAPVRSRLLIGTTPAGMRETTRLFGELDSDVPLRVKVETQQLGTSNPVDFRIRDLQAGQVFTTDATYGSVNEFIAAMDDDVPCDDPTGERAARRFGTMVLWVEVALLAVLVMLIAVDMAGVRRRRATMP